MKILLICEQLDGRDGWSRYSETLRAALVQAGHDVRVLTRTQLGAPLPYLTRPWKAWLNARKVRKVIRSFEPDAIHVTVEPYALMVPFFGKDNAVRTVLTIHGSYGVRLFDHSTTRARAYRALSKMGRCITISNYTKSRVAEELPESLRDTFLGKTTVIHNGTVLPGDWQPLPKEDVKKQIILVGGVKPRKGVLEALNACAQYRERFGTPFTFTIVGNLDQRSDYLKQVKDKIRELNLDNDVVLKGTVSDEELTGIYRRADLLLLPAHVSRNTFEGFGLVYLEANAYGVPCIGPTESGAAEAIDDGKSGYHADSNSPGGIAEKMNRILNERSISAEDCRRWAEDHNMKKTADAVFTVYKELL